MTLGPAATGVIRQEYVLDGVIELRSEILTWSLPSGGEDDRLLQAFCPGTERPAGVGLR